MIAVFVFIKFVDELWRKVIPIRLNQIFKR